MGVIFADDHGGRQSVQCAGDVICVGVTTVRQHIRQASGDLSEAQKVAADYLLENTTKVAFCSTEEFASKAGVSTATIVRLAQALGYEGFQALKKALQDEIRLLVSPTDKVQKTLVNMGDDTDTFAAVVEMEISYLKQALNTISTVQMEEAVKAIGNANKVGVLGLGVSESLVHLLTFRLRRFKVDVIPMVRGGRDLYEDLHWLNRGDVLLTFAFLQPWPEGLISLKHAREVGATSVVITDLESSPALDLADIGLVAQRGPVGAFHSLVVPNAVVNALILAYAKHTQETSLANLEHFQDVRLKMRAKT